MSFKSHFEGLFQKGHGCDFPEKGQGNVEGLNIWKFGQTWTKFGKFLKKDRWLHVITAHNKLLEYVMILLLFKFKIYPILQ